MGCRSTAHASPRRWGVDLAPFRSSSAYRRLFLYGALGTLASQATYVTLMYQLKILTDSALDVGVLGLVELLPIIVFGLYGGVLADHFNRRRVVLGAELGLFAVTGVLFVNARLSHPSVAVIYLVAAAFAALNGILSPSYAALFQQLVPHDLQRESATLQMVQGTGASILGPAIGGLVAVAWGPAAVYGGDLASYVVTVLLLVGLHVEHRAGGAEKPDFAAFASGARYAWSRPDVLGTYVIDLVAMTMAYPVTLLPFVAATYHSSYALAVLYCGIPTGALLATLSSRWTGKVSHYGRAIAVAAVLWGGGIIIFGVARSLPLAFVGLVIGGGADAVSGIFRTTMWNESIPLDVRGRMAGIELLSFSVGPTAGQFRAGVMAAATTVRISLVAGGVACAGTCAVLPLALRSTWNFDVRGDPHVAAVRAARANEQFD